MDKLLIDKVKKYDWGKSRAALTEFEDSVRDAYGKKSKLKKIEDNLLKILVSDATRAGKQFACRQLSVVGTRRSIPALREMLTDDETSDMARYALERIPDEAVNDALRAALPKATGKMKIGIINTLSSRRDSKSVSLLDNLVSDSDAMVAEAAIAALGNIADSEATKVLAQVKDKTSDKLKLPVLDAYLKCADRLAAQGKKDEALAIYKQMYKSDKPTSIRTAALRGIVTVTKEVKK